MQEVINIIAFYLCETILLVNKINQKTFRLLTVRMNKSKPIPSSLISIKQGKYQSVKNNPQMREQIHDIDCVFDGLDGRGAIYISDYRSASQKSLRQSLNIKAVISIASGAYIEYHEELSQYLYIPAKDAETYDISNHFEDTFQFLEKHRRNGNVLVHCMVGKSRSATIVAAYLLKKFRYSLPTVMNLLRRKRKKVDPNPGFMNQLQTFSKKIGLDNQLHSHQSKSLSRSQRTVQYSHKSKQKLKQKIQRLTNYSEKEQENQKNQVLEKIEKIRQRYLNKRRCNQKTGKKMYEGLIGLVSSGSVTLKKAENQVQFGNKAVKSAELSANNNIQ